MSKLWIPPQKITCRALALVWRKDELLMLRVDEESGVVKGYRPLGGGIEFGETSDKAVVREVREELGCELLNPRLIGWVENVYHMNSATGHEVMALWQGELSDKSIYEQDKVAYVELDKIAAGCFLVWKNPFTAELPVYPDGLTELLKRK